MGSGQSGLYSGTIGSSQPYASSYAVTPNMLRRDEELGIYGPKGYRKNPTAKEIGQIINGNYIVDKHTNVRFVYAVDTNGNVIVGRRNGNGKTGKATPHPTLIGGKNPKVKIAGVLDIRGGKYILMTIGAAISNQM